ncbi:ABC transporter ATP-binding protein [Bifidobacterium pseudocatenulatum]|uniref:ABC transporter ATP-binding protein n=1 Tax=Bifidobacterium pseudocatenulatum TaxID=28026 RepID=UPI001CFD6687|nr:ABC transporter ATP-binding protein [Bifidobacterium pseudocatenulatum]MCB4886150.1 ABC transporter ATP-binding protein [Bifidobacterium pseudocatenulatum]
MAEVAMVEEKNVDERPVVLKVDHVAKMFRLPTEQATGLKMAFLNWTKGIKGYTEQHVLRDINFEVRQGDFFGIVGRNGSGKSTLLKIISQIYTPEHGSVTVKGKLVPFIELGVGFNPELTGRENVYLNGALLGFTRAEIDAMYDDIVEFAELEEFMDQKLKNYSSGMQVRLAFSVAIKAQGDILVLDEVLAVGDEAFQRKCDNFFAEIKKDPTKTVILVTHSMDSVKKYCNKAILIKDGEIIASGDKNDVADRYTLENLKSEHKERKENPEDEYPLGLSEKVPTFRILPVSPQISSCAETFEFDVEYDLRDSGGGEFYIPMSVLDVKRGGVPYDCGVAFKFSNAGHNKIHFALPLSIFNDGDFKIIATMRKIPDTSNLRKFEQLAFTSDENSCYFSVRNPGTTNFAGLLNDKALHIDCLGTSRI